MNTVLLDRRLNDWKIIPIFLLAALSSCSGRAESSVSSRKTLPSVGRSSRLIHRIRVLFPAPLRPITPNIEPFPMFNDTSLSAWKSAFFPAASFTRYILLTPSRRINCVFPLQTKSKALFLFGKRQGFERIKGTAKRF